MLSSIRIGFGLRNLLQSVLLAFCVYGATMIGFKSLSLNTDTLKKQLSQRKVRFLDSIQRGGQKNPLGDDATLSCISSVTNP